MAPSKKKKSVAFAIDNDFVLDPKTICANWTRLWSSFGFTTHQWTSRANKVEEYTKQLLNQKFSTYKEQVNQRKCLVKQSIDEYEDLIARTGLTSTIEMKTFDEFKLREQEVYIEKKMQELLINEGELLQQRNDFEREQKHLCSLLNATPMEFDDQTPMSLKQINEKLQEHIQMLSDLKSHRLNQITSYYTQMKDYAERLEWTPTSPLIEHLFQQHFENCLTAESLNQIETTLHELEIRIEEQKARYFVLHDQLTRLYERLGKDSCVAYRTAGEYIDAMTIKHLEEEIELCREERLKNGKAYRDMIHRQIEDLLDQAHLSDDHRMKLEELGQETLSADLLDRYDAEYQRISQLYQKRKPILDGYEKWLQFWKDFAAFTKASTDPTRFRTRGYNAQAEGRKRKKFLRELPIIEQEFQNILSEWKTSPFLIDNTPIEEKLEEMRRQVPASALPSSSSTTAARTIVAATPSPRLRTTPVQFRTLAVTPRRPPLGSASSNRLAKTPAITPSRKFPAKLASRTEHQTKRAKPLPAPPSQTTPAVPHLPLPVHPAARTDDQVLDFSLLHTVKNAHGQIKVMTSTPNSSLITTDHHERGKTAFNPIEQRRLRRRSHRSPVPIVIVHNAPDETVPCV